VRFKRAAPFLLVAGAIAAFGTMTQKAPQERPLELRVEDPASLRDLEVAWIDPNGETAQSGRWHYEVGQAPELVKTTLRVPDARYDVVITTARSDGEHVVHRSVTVSDPGSMTLRVLR
jgi:hypothetical protein